MQLCLGTVQFGMDYGIAGQKQPEIEDAVRCLDYATQNTIKAIDTAEAYGTAENVVGEFLKRKTIARDKLQISAKLLPNCLDDVSEDEYVNVIEAHLKNTLLKLHTDYLDGYLLHSARYAFNDAILGALAQMVQKGYAKKVGVSVYEPKEAHACFDNKDVTFIQAPYSIFDHRMKDAGVFERVENVDVHTRSAFIQGLIMLDENRVPPFLHEAKPILKRIDAVSKKTGFSRVELAMAYVKREERISHLVFGVDSLEQLKEDVRVFEREIPSDLLSDLEKEFAGIKAEVVMPSLWKK